LTQGLQGSAQCFAGASGGERGCASGDVRTEMCEQGRIFNAGFAVFCAGFRRGERGCGERGCLAGMFFFKIVGLRKNIRVNLW